LDLLNIERGGAGDQSGAGGWCEALGPGPLIFGESAGFDLDPLDGVIERNPIEQVIEELLVPQRLGCVWAEAACGVEGADLVEQAALDHVLHAGVDAAVDGFDGPVEDDELRVGAGGAGVPLALVGGDGRAGLLEDFEGADGSADVVEVDAGGGVGVDALKLGAARVRVHGGEALAEGGVGGRAFEEAFEEGFDVEVCAADDDGDGVAGADVVDGVVGEGEPLIDAEAVGGIDEVDEVVADAALLGGGGFGGADVEAAVDLEGVGGDDLAGGAGAGLEGEGELDGEGGLSAGGGATDDGEGGHGGWYEMLADEAVTYAGAMASLRIGHVRYLNTLPLVEGLSAWREVELVQAVPAALAPMLTGEGGGEAEGGGERRIDIGLCSVIDVARSSEPLTLIPSGMIGCDGPTLTVRMYSAVPWDRVTRLYADTESHTSVVLARVLLKRRFGVTPEVVDYDAVRHAEAGQSGSPGSAGGAGGAGGFWPETLLIIGDKVVTDAPPAERYPHQMDLGEAWHEWTGLPFVYAMWMCRSADAGKPAVRLAAELLERQRLRNTVRLDWLVARYAGERGWPAALAGRYVGELLRYGVGPREREGVLRFLGEAAELGLAARVAPEWLGAG
jgi:chorismate dehydratase